MSGNTSDTGGVLALKCDPKNGFMAGCSWGDRLTDTGYVVNGLFRWENIVYLAFIILFMYVARLTYQVKIWLMLRSQDASFTLGGGFRKALTEDDNKAVAVSFAGYVLGVGLILWASMSDMKRDDAGKTIGKIVLWQAIGVVFMEIARYFSDLVVLRGSDNNVELVRGNVAIGCAEAGVYVGTGLVVLGAIAGPETELGSDILSSVIWFVLGQIGFTIFAFIINTKLYVGFDFLVELKNQNVAAGLLFGLEMVSVGLLVSNATIKSDALLTYLVWYLLGGLVLILTRYLIDLIIIPGQTLTGEIQRDRNIGAALLIGGVHLGIVHVINTFLPDKCVN